MKTVALVAVLNALAVYGLWYITYWRYDLTWAPFDSRVYTDLAVHVWDTELPPPDPELGRLPDWTLRPPRYRVLTPLLARLLSRLPLYETYNPRNPQVRDQLSPEVEELVYNLTLLNYLYLVLASALVFYYAHQFHRVPLYLAYAGSLWFLTTFYNTLQSYPPHSDAGCHLLIAAALVAYQRQSGPGFLAATLLGAIQKETVILVVGLFLFLELARGRRDALKWMLLCVPSIAFYVLFTRLLPVPGLPQYDPDWNWAWQFLGLLDPRTYDLHFVMRHLVGNLPFLAALAGHLFLLGRGRAVDYPWAHLALFPILFVISRILGVNLGRIVSLGTFVYLMYEMKVVQALFEYLAPADAEPERGPGWA